MKWLLRRVAGWPLPLVAFAGGVLGWLAWLFSPSYRRRIAENTALAGLTAPQRRHSVAEVGRLFLEVPWLWFRDRERPVLPLIRQWQGAEQVEQALAQGRGLVLLKPHLGGFEMSACAYAERFGPTQPITVLYRPARQAWLAEVQTTARTRPYMQAAPASLAGRAPQRPLPKGGGHRVTARDPGNPPALRHLRAER